MKIDYANRIAPEDRDYVCKDNERLVTSTEEKEEAGADEQLNYAIYFVKDVEVLAKEVYAFIDFAKSYPDLRFIVQLDSFAYALVGSETLIPLFARAMGSQSNPTAEMFRNKYVENHTPVYEGRNLPDVLWI